MCPCALRGGRPAPCPCRAARAARAPPARLLAARLRRVADELEQRAARRKVRARRASAARRLAACVGLLCALTPAALAWLLRARGL
ncbi:activator of apoptosis harakiri [Eudromia elegans]